MVALLAEGVDRNKKAEQRGATLSVALLAEGVDRNLWRLRTTSRWTMSPSSLRAWIEIKEFARLVDGAIVALLAEGVDRNSSAARMMISGSRSPSSRRAWIEIHLVEVT